MVSPELTIIIPVYNEAATVGHTLPQLRQTMAQERVPMEVIVVDGGSTDDTVSQVQRLGFSVIQIPQGGRGRQLNAGAQAARGRWLLFLHVDSALPQGFWGAIAQILTQDATVGAFRLRIEASGWAYRMLERCILWRSQWVKLPYGDQGFFLSRDYFEALGGFPELAIMEDFVFIRRAQTRGPVAIAPLAITTSARRWQRFGIVRTTVINQLMVFGYGLGISPTRLRRWYRSGFTPKPNAPLNHQ